MNRNFQNRGRKGFSTVAVVALLLALIATPVSVLAQEDPFGETDFTSPKFGTLIEWSDGWGLDEDQSSVQQRRDIIGLYSLEIDAAVLIELQSQRSFRTAEAFINTAMERYTSLAGFEQTFEDLSSYPPSLQFEFGEDEESVIAGHIQAQAIDGAMIAVIVLGLPGELVEAMEAANDQIEVNGEPLLEALPVCGEESEASAGATPDGSDSESNSSDDDKTSSFSGRSNQAAGEIGCVDVFVPTPATGEDAGTPEPTPTTSSGRGSGLNNTAYTSPTFPNVSLQYNKKAWEVSENVAGEENNGRDLLLLSHAELPAVLYIETYAGHNGRAGACIDLAMGEAGISPGSDEPLEDENGDLIQGSVQGRIWGAFAFELELEDGAVEAGGYVECRALPGASGVLVVTMIVRIESFDDAYQELQPILQSIVVG